MDAKSIKNVVKTIDEISNQMTDVIYLNYFDKLGNENKYILSLCDDAFKTASVICYAIQRVAIAQFGSLLRQLLEQVSLINILVMNNDYLTRYIDHYKFRIKISSHKKQEQWEEISKKYGISNNANALTFLDYGWISKNAKEVDLIIKAGFEDILTWRKQWLDKLVHSSLTSINLLGQNNDFPIIEPFTQITAKLFDHLCVSFHNLTKFAFIFNEKDLFSEFRKYYSDLVMNIDA